MSDEQPAVVVKGLYKSFRLPHEQHNGIKQLLVNFWKRKKGYEVQHVLDDVSFEIKKGEFFGIVGRNGSGKSTLLKLLAGIYAPDKGLVHVNGSLTPFIELGVGFNPELTGRENVFMNGALLGFGRKEMEAMYDDIVGFAELERFMDQKLKNYSSGMQVRLAFSIAIRAQSDVLLIDEVLAVGDAAFQQKCFAYFEKLKSNNQTIILVTHDMGAVRQFCDRAMLVNQGEIVAIGSPDHISDEYEKLNFRDQNSDQSIMQNSKLQVHISDQNGKDKDTFEYGEDIHIGVNWDSSFGKITIVGVMIYRGSEVVYATNSINQIDIEGTNEATLILSPKLGNGRYKVQAAIFGRNRHEVIEHSEMIDMSVYGQPKLGVHNDEWLGVAYIDNGWKVNEKL